jgi:hypothetical protein
MDEFKLVYNANQTFAQVHSDPNKYLFIRGPVGSGKSSGCIWHIVLNAFKQRVAPDGIRYSNYGIIRASYPALKSTVVKSWKIWFRDLVKIIYDTPIRGVMTLDHPDGVTTCQIDLNFIALDREEDVNKLQSLELTGCHINEAAEIPPGVHQMLKSRINRFPAKKDGGVTDPFIICDYNSVPSDHWLYTLAEETEAPKHNFYHQPPALLKVDPGEGHIVDAAGNYYKVNPDADNIENLEDDYYEDQVYGADPDWVNVMILNNYGELRTGKPVYPEYIDSIHYDAKLTDAQLGLPIIIGMDLGLTPAAAFMQLTPTGKLIIFDEIVTEDCSIRKFCEDYLKPHIQNNYSRFNFMLIIDPAATIRSQNDARSASEIIGGSPPLGSGLPYRTAKTQNELKRREAVVYFLRKVNGFSIGPKCPYIRKGFISEYKYEKKRVAVSNVRGSNHQNFKEKPEKNLFSHVHDAIQYGCLELSEGRSVRKRIRRTEKPHNTPADSSAGY